MKTRHSNCGCGAEIVQIGRGPTRIRCEPCGDAHKKAAKNKSRRTKPDATQCACGNRIEQKLGVGRMLAKCVDCRPKPKPRGPSKGPYQKLPPRRTDRTCNQCGISFSYIKEGGGCLRKFCSDRCSIAFHERRTPEKPCLQCGKPFNPRRMSHKSRATQGLFCGRGCAQAFRKDTPDVRRMKCAAYGSRRRALKKSVTVERFTHTEVYERDRWKCGLCGKRVDKRLRYPDPMSASLDHIVPLCDGGEHSLRNSQCSHWICNSRKTFGAGGQMRLFG